MLPLVNFYGFITCKLIFFSSEIYICIHADSWASHTFARVLLLNTPQITQFQCAICLPLGSWLPRYILSQMNIKGCLCCGTLEGERDLILVGWTGNAESGLWGRVTKGLKEVDGEATSGGRKRMMCVCGGGQILSLSPNLSKKPGNIVRILWKGQENLHSKWGKRLPPNCQLLPQRRMRIASKRGR